MKQHALGLSAFSLPKLKRDVAAKLLPSRGDSFSDSDKQQTAADSHNSKGAGAENIDPASPHLAPNAKAAGKQPATARKASRRAKQVRTSEQHTVFYDALGSPEDDATARNPHNLRGGAATAAAPAAAPAAAAPASVRSKPSSRHAAAAAAGADADADAGIVRASAGFDPELFTSQPEPMEEDEDEPYAAACAGPAGKTPAAGRRTSSRAPAQQPQQLQDRDREAQHVPRPSSRQQRHAAAAAAASADAHDAQQDSRQQPQRRAAGARSGRSSAERAVEEAAAMALDTSDDSDAGGSEPAAAAAVAGRQGSQDHLRDGQEIYKYMKQLAEDASELLPQDEADGGKRRGRGRPKKDLRLVDALHQSWQGKSYYERLQEITRAELAQQEEDQRGQDDTTATLALEYHPSTQQPSGPITSRPAGAAAAAAAERSSSDKDAARLKAAAAAAAAGKAGAAGAAADAVAGRKRRAGRQGQSAEPADAADADADADLDTAVKAPSSKRRATLAATTASAAAAAAAGGGSSRNGRRATIVAGRSSTLAGAGTGGGAAAAVAKSPLPGGRPTSSRMGGWDGTPAAVASLADRPPFTVGGPSTGGPAGAAAAGAGAAGGAGGGTTAAKAERGALQKLQAAFDTKCEELVGVRDQLKESQELVSRLRQDQKAHPKALQQLEKQRQALEKKLDGAGRREAVLQRDNEALQERLARQEEEKSALQDQLSKSEREVKALRLKLKQVAAKLEKAQTLGVKLQELGAGLVADAQAPAFE